MYLLLVGIVLWFLWLLFYWYDISSFYQSGYRIKSGKIRDALNVLFYTALGFMCVGTYWLYCSWLLSLIVS